MDPPIHKYLLVYIRHFGFASDPRKSAIIRGLQNPTFANSRIKVQYQKNKTAFKVRRSAFDVQLFKRLAIACQQ